MFNKTKDEFRAVGDDEIQVYREALLRFLLNFENPRSTEELNRLKKLVAALHSTISALRELGVPYGEIATQLELKGLVIDGDTLQYMHCEHCDQIAYEQTGEIMRSWADTLMSQAKKQL